MARGIQESLKGCPMWVFLAPKDVSRIIDVAVIGNTGAIVLECKGFHFLLAGEEDCYGTRNEGQRHGTRREALHHGKERL